MSYWQVWRIPNSPAFGLVKMIGINLSETGRHPLAVGAEIFACAGTEEEAISILQSWEVKS